MDLGEAIESLEAILLFETFPLEERDVDKLTTGRGDKFLVGKAVEVAQLRHLDGPRPRADGDHSQLGSWPASSSCCYSSRFRADGYWDGTGLYLVASVPSVSRRCLITAPG